MSAFYTLSFSQTAFGPSAFDFGSTPPPVVVTETNTPGFMRRKLKLKAQFRGVESDEEKYARRLSQGIISVEPPKAPEKPKPNGLKMAVWKKRD
jgi:hypothetical protein